MDCERFDRIVLDLLYEELDELTAAAARRHLEHCARCRGVLAGLRATREVGALPLVDPPDGLELRILEAERQMRGHLPLRQRAGRAVSVLAGYAMRPQLAMAATLLIVIGGGLFFFRGRPSERDTVSVTERGVAESDPETVTVLPKGAVEDPGTPAHGAVAASPAPAEARRPEAAPPRQMAASASASSSPAAEIEGDGVYDSALQAFGDKRYKEARQQFESVVARGGSKAAEAALYAAKSTLGSDECAAAAPLFDQVSQRYPGTRAGYEATWDAATCYEKLGDLEKARRSYQALDDTGYAARARAALAQLDRVDQPAARLASRKKPVALETGLENSKSGAGSNASPGSAPAQAAPAKASVDLQTERK